MSDQINNNKIKWCDRCIYKLIKDLILPLVIIVLGLTINSKIGQTERHLKMVEILNEKIEGDYQDIEYLNQLFNVVDPKFSKKLKKITDYRLIELKFEDFNSSEVKIRSDAINDLKDYYEIYPRHIIEMYINEIPDSIQTIKWSKAICIAKGMWLLGEWQGDSSMFNKVKSFEFSPLYADERIKVRILETLKNFNERE
ncbi:MAG: hypothetical protein R2750_05935 [Bacteroidales bacterium]